MTHVIHREKTADYVATVLMTGVDEVTLTSDDAEAMHWTIKAVATSLPEADVELQVWEPALGGYVDADPSHLGDW
jgi:anti-sigma-K factor RskA